jgi:hypothetical protein
LKAVGSEEDFMQRPTEELCSYLAAQSGTTPEAIRKMLHAGRVAMAMELITVAKVIEDHSLLPSKEDTIAVIQTLIIDQDLLEAADEWYHRLSDWRRIKLYGDASEDAVLFHRSVASVLSDLRGALPPERSTDAPPGSDQSQGHSCGD